MNAAVLTVSQVNFFIKSLIEGDGRLQSVVVSGEISNFTDHYRSGHLYFSLKDEKSVLKAVMFASAARRLKFRPQDGMKVLIRGRVAVYEPTGQYQLYAEDMQPEGIGALSLAFACSGTLFEHCCMFPGSQGLYLKTKVFLASHTHHI